MKVLQVINSLASGGAEVFVTDLSIALATHCEVQVLVYAGVLDEKGRSLAEKLDQAGVVLHNLETRKNAQKWRVPLQIARIVDSTRPDVVNVHLDASELFCALAAHLARHRPIYVRTLHNSIVVRYEARWIQFCLRRFYDWNIACARAVLESPALSLPADRSSVVENGTNLRTQGGQRDKLAVRARLGLPGDSTVLVNIGSMRGGGKGGMPKAQDVLIRAFAGSGLASRALLVLVGDGKNRGDLERMCLEVGVRDSVRFTGIVPDPHDFYAAADLVVMPSREEGLSIAAIEAACAGIPLILSDIEPFELFSGEGVRRCTVESTDSLANVIKDAVKEIDILRRQAEESARLWRERFDIARTAKRYMDIYEMLHDRDPLPLHTGDRHYGGTCRRHLGAG